MNLYLTKKLADTLKGRLDYELQPDHPVPGLFMWRAHYVQEQGQKFVVFMNEATRFTIVINEAMVAKLKQLPDLFFTTLRDTLIGIHIHPTAIERYIQDLGEISYFKETLI